MWDATLVHWVRRFKFLRDRSDGDPVLSFAEPADVGQFYLLEKVSIDVLRQRYEKPVIHKPRCLDKENKKDMLGEQSRHPFASLIDARSEHYQQASEVVQAG
ncbi:hypothetical protein [Pelomonas cellulosilytica]|uniref:Uncharacterized protein n=1 Tax=Pelomonas cellulosilytica TaxID=2906762 RepID=A0ABS8XNA0_9BURK|nr:hypothetical protein [Pelomonas sp. P8]MCE4554237.1 hypothetical protein [Pelomonas sp. P8]